MKGTLHLDWFDPANPIGSLVEPTTNGHGTRDNYGSITLAPTTLEFTSADNGVKHVLCTFEYDANTKKSAHAGDNYIVAVHPNEGCVEKYRFEEEEHYITSNYYGTIGRTLMYPEPGRFGDYEELPGNLQTEMLTVWRTLWVECDHMALPDPNPMGLTQPPKPDISLAHDAFLTTCVDVQEVPDDWNPRPTALFASPIGETTNPNYLGVSTNCRDIALNQVTETFWCVHGIGANEEIEGRSGVATRAPDGGSFFVFRKTIFDDVESASPNEPMVGGVEGQWARTTYHEIMHYFDFTDVLRIMAILKEIVEDIEKIKGFKEQLDRIGELEIILAENYRGNMSRFVRERYPDHKYLLSRICYDGDPEHGIMDYGTIAYGTWEDIELKLHQIVQIQSLPNPSPLW